MVSSQLIISSGDMTGDNRSICPVTGLPITRRPEWTDVLFDTDTDYKSTFSILGDRILLAKTSGHATLHGVENALSFLGNLETEVIDGDRPYVNINDWSALQGASLEARKYYIDYMKKNKQLLGLIFYGTSPMFKLSIKLAKRLNIVKFNVQIANDYPEAVKLALEILSTAKTQSDNSSLTVTPQPSVDCQKEDKVCPVTGLPITTRTEWTDIDLGEGYSVTFKFIGDRILLSIPRGKSGEHGMENLMRERVKVRDAMLRPEEHFFEIKDYSGVGSRVTRAGRNQFAKGMIADKDRIIGFIGYHAPLAVRLAINVGKRLHSSPFPMFAVNDYETAIKNAIEALKNKGYGKEALPPEVITSDDWSLQTDGFSARFEIINGHIFHVVTTGFFEEEHIAPVFKMHEKVTSSMDAPEGSFYFVLGVTELRGSSGRARKLYIDRLKGWHDKHPFRVGILYGTNRFLGAAFNLAKPFLSFNARITKNLDGALKLIAEDKTKTIKPAPALTVGDAAIEPLASDQTRQYVDDLLHFVGRINWESDGLDDSREIDLTHPFNPVFDAIALIKNDLDDLFHERKKAEESLRESEEKYRDIFENVSDFLYSHDLEGNFTETNLAWKTEYGFTEDYLANLNVRDLIPERYKHQFYDYLNRVKENGKDEGLMSVMTKDGRVRILEYKNSLVHDSTGPIGVQGSARDITERIQAQKALRESEEKYRTILKSIEDGYYEVDIRGNFTFFNDSMCKILGYTKDELIGMNNRQYTDEENAKKVYQIFNKIYTTGKPAKGFDWEFIRKDGNKVSIETSVSLIKDAESKPIGFRGIARDISERKQAEKLEQEKIEAEAASRAKSEFLANMSHEIRTPLNGIIGMAELALDTDLDDNQKNILHTINTETNSLQDVINEILDFSKIESRKVELEEIPFDLRVTIEDMASSFAYRAEQKGLHFISFLSPDVPSRLIGDPGRLRQILVNLTGNALKFTNKGEIYIKAEIAEDLGDKVKIRFLVKDTGIGIPKEKQATIFESFTQADGSTTRTYGGTGLGTTISKQLVEMMGGEISLESPADRNLKLETHNSTTQPLNHSTRIGGPGSTFWFTAVFTKQKEKKPTPAKEPDLSNLRVLVVDDNRTNRYILTEYLSSWGCKPVEAMDGKEALSILRHSVSSEEPFNLILTDFQMPEMSGFDLAKEIRAMETLKRVPIIVLTSVGTRGDGKSCRDIGINGYLAKPIRRDDLHMAIVSVLGLSKGKEVDTYPKLVTRHTIAEGSRKEVQILLAEDYPTNQQVAIRHLSKAGYQVDLAEDGRQAVEAYRRKDYDLILMDIQMPLMDGYEATREIRKLETHHSTTQPLNHLPIIAMTAHATKGYREKCLKAGMDDYIAKPLRRKELLAMVEKWTKTIDNCRLRPVGAYPPACKPYGLEAAPEGLKIENCKDETRNMRSEAAGNSQSSIVNSQSKAPMNFEVAIEEFEGDKAFLMEVLDGFLENVRAQIGTIHQAISDGDAEVVRREAHSIKGGAANLTANELSGIAFELENIGKSGALEGGIGCLDRLEEEFRRLEDYVRDK